MLAAHTPDDSFAGFVIEHQDNGTKTQPLPRKNIALVYGKNPNVWKVAIYYCRLKKKVPLFSFFPHPLLPLVYDTL